MFFHFSTNMSLYVHLSFIFKANSTKLSWCILEFKRGVYKSKFCILLQYKYIILIINIEDIPMNVHLLFK
jgi:hypothetical protein